MCKIVMQHPRTSEIHRRLLTVLFQTYLLMWVNLDNVVAQFDYDNDGTRVRSGLTAAQMSSGQNQWDSVNQALFDKCMQFQRMGMKKRNFGLEIPGIIMNRVQGGTEGNPAVKEMRARMMTSGKRK